jgi:hypothetical protein
VDLLPDRLQVVGGLLEGIELAVEEVEGLGAVGLRRQQVDQVEPELLRELADVEMTLVDQLAAVLVDQVRAGELVAPAAPANAGRF